MLAARVALAAGDRAAHDHEAGVLRQVAYLRRAPLALVEDPDVSLVELAPEGLDGRVVAGLILGAPFREGGVACGVHADQSRHRYLLGGRGIDHQGIIRRASAEPLANHALDLAAVR